MFIAPLRLAIIRLVETGKPFTVEAVSVFGTASRSQAKRYVNILANDGVVLVMCDGRMTRGWAFTSWSTQEPKTKPGGHRKILYRAVKREPCLH
jgi:hypothetical protein